MLIGLVFVLIPPSGSSALSVTSIQRRSLSLILAVPIVV
jgi:hypothetical protein